MAKGSAAVAASRARRESWSSAVRAPRSFERATRRGFRTGRAARAGARRGAGDGCGAAGGGAGAGTAGTDVVASRRAASESPSRVPTTKATR